MLQQARDVLAVAPKTSDTEIEFRFSIPGQLFDQAHSHWRTWANCAKDPVDSLVLCNNDSDLRCVDGNWERKRVVDFVRLPIAGKLSTRLCVSVESAAAPPSHPECWCIRRRRRRWTYSFPSWDVVWTLVDSRGEIEIEFTGEPLQLVDSESVCNLGTPLQVVISCVAFAIDSACYAAPGVAVPYVRSRKNHCTSGVKTHTYMKQCMRSQQPVSLTAGRQRRVGDVCVSLKYDGIRAMLYVDVKQGVPVCWMMLRDKKMYSVPCLECDQPMILDGELMGDTFVAFDVVSINGAHLPQVPFKQRLKILRSSSMPIFLTFKVQIKQFYSINFPPEFVELASGTDVDGIVIHATGATLRCSNPMYKWKSSHTLDVHCRKGKAYAEDGPLDMPFSEATSDGLWECRIVGQDLVPLKKRTDKTTANPRHVCNDILNAHSAGIDILDIPAIFS